MLCSTVCIACEEAICSLGKGGGAGEGSVSATASHSSLLDDF